MFEGWHDEESHAKEEDQSLHVGLVVGCMYGHRILHYSRYVDNMHDCSGFYSTVITSAPAA